MEKQKFKLFGGAIRRHVCVCVDTHDEKWPKSDLFEKTLAFKNEPASSPYQGSERDLNPLRLDWVQQVPIFVPKRSKI